MRSSCRSSCGVGPSCAGSRSSSAAPATVASWRPRRTRRVGTACTRRCRRRSPVGAARTPCSCPAITSSTREVSEQVHEIFGRYTPLIEPLSLDEAFLDVSGATAAVRRRARRSRERIRTDVRDELELGCSVGVAPNKFLAKLASVEAKPRATPRTGAARDPAWSRSRPGEELEFLHPLPVSTLWGVGPKTLEKLERLGVRTVGDLAGARRAHRRRQPRPGQRCAPAGACRTALDDRPVEVDREPKSIGHEETYPHDLPRARRPRARAGAPGRRRVGPAAATRHGGPDPDAEGPVRRVPHRHPIGHAALGGRHRPGDRRRPATARSRALDVSVGCAAARRVDQQLRRSGPAAQPARRARAIASRTDRTAGADRRDPERFGAAGDRSGQLAAAGAGLRVVRAGRAAVGPRPATPTGDPGPQAIADRRIRPCALRNRLERAMTDGACRCQKTNNGFSVRSSRSSNQDPTFSERGYRVSRRRLVMLAVGLRRRAGPDGRRPRRSASGWRSAPSSACSRWRCCSRPRSGSSVARSSATCRSTPGWPAPAGSAPRVDRRPPTSTAERQPRQRQLGVKYRLDALHGRQRVDRDPAHLIRPQLTVVAERCAERTGAFEIDRCPAGRS